MTKVRYRDTNLYQEMEITGHAEKVPPGGVSVVCAGISAITQTLYENIQREEARGQIRADGGMPERGKMWIRAWTTDENRDAIRHMFRFTLTGLEAIRDQYPENIEIREENLNGNL